VFSIKSLRAKTLLSTLVPSVLVLAAVAVIALYAYERVTRDIVRQRDTELARISAAHLAESLGRFSRPLRNVAVQEDIRSMEPARLSSALDRYQDQLYAFDGGVVVYDSTGVALASQPLAGERQGTTYPLTTEFDEIRGTLRPVFSNVLQDEVSGEEVVLVGVPIIDSGNEFTGVLAGIATLRYSALGETYAEVLELTGGGEPFAYLVDGSGRVIHHRHSFVLGRDLGSTVPVMRATGGETGAVITEDPSGEMVISGFAPVPGTSWAVITQERWENVVGPIRGYNRLLLALLVVGGVLSAALIFIAMGRILKPIKDLTRGAQRIAGGDFDHTIAAKTGDEIQALAQQFNTMAGSLKESYTDLERRVAERTRELHESEERLRTVVTGAPVVLFALDREGVFTFSEGTGLNALGLKPGEVVGQSAFDVYRDVPEIVENIRHALAGEEFTATVEVAGLAFETRYSPVRGENGEIVGLIGVANDVTERKQAEEALQKAEAQYRSIFENAVDGIYQSAPDGRILTANPAMACIFGYESPEELVSAMSNVEHQLFVEPDKRGEELHLLEERGTISGFEFQAYRKDGSIIWISDTTRTVRDESGRVLYYEGTIEDVTERKQAEEAIREVVVLEERNRMAREIHDTLAQGFTGIVLQLEAAEQASEEIPAEVPGHLTKAKKLARESLQEARRSVWNLLPQALEERPVDVALHEEVRRFAAEGREQASFSLSGTRRGLAADNQAALLRICQESLTNIRKHAGATEVKVALAFHPDAVCLTIQDNGVGFDAESVEGADRRSGVGLTSMKQRAHLFRGTFAMRSEKGKGTLVEVRIPTE